MSTARQRLRDARAEELIVRTAALGDVAVRGLITEGERRAEAFALLSAHIAALLRFHADGSAVRDFLDLRDALRRLSAISPEESRS